MNGNKSTGNIIWHKFVERILTGKLLKAGGWLVFVHPPLWRKPTTSKTQIKGIYKLLTQDNQMLCLEMYDTASGEMTFKCGTKYDWYVVEKKVRYTTTVIKDEMGERHVLNLKDWLWLPNGLFERVATLLFNNKCIDYNGDRILEEAQPVLYNCLYHASHKTRVVDTKSEQYPFPLVHSTPSKGVRLKYTNLIVAKDVMYGVSKVICGETGFGSVVNDYLGTYATTQGAFALPVNDAEDGEMLVKLLRSVKFSEVLKVCTWGNYRIDWCLFGCFRRGFWRV